MDTVEILVQARCKIIEPSNWTQGYLAGTRQTHGRGSMEKFCHPKAEEANCWCPVGALQAVLVFGEDVEFDLAICALADAIRSLYEPPVPRKIFDICTSLFSRTQKSARLIWINTVTDFNDAKGRMHSEVVSVFDLAIASEMTKRERKAERVKRGR